MERVADEHWVEDADRGCSDAQAPRVLLAHQPPILLGPLRIEPAMRRIVHDDGRDEILEQRVMQVLVALLRADGAILTRDELIETCWDGRIVGDDAINRVMSRLRRTAEGIGAGVFRIETITKIGYRLVRNDDLADALPGSAAERALPFDAAQWRVRWLLGALAAIVIAVAGGLLLARPGAGAAETIVRVDPFEVRAGDAAASDFGRDLAADLSRFANAAEHGFVVVEPGTSRAESADYVVRASIGGDGGKIRALARLVQASDGEIVWSRAFERPAAEAAAMREQMAVRIADVIVCSKRAGERGDRRFGTESLRLIFTACGLFRDQRFSEVRELLSQLVEREPSFATGWAWLAKIEAAEALRSPRPEEHAVFQEARRHAARAIALDAREGYAYSVLAATVTGRQPWVERVRILERGIALDPGNEHLWFDYSEALRQVGRLNDSLTAARRATALDPLSPFAFGMLIQTLLYSGQVDAATELMAEGERRWPERMPMNRFQLAIETGDAARALEMLESSSYVRERLQPHVELVRLGLQASLDPSPAKRQRLLADFRQAAAAEPRRVNMASMLVFHGMEEEALQLLAGAGLASWEPDILFAPEAAAMRRDPRIFVLAHRHGLVRYWMTSGHWPDFCADRSLPFDCRAEARRLLAGAG